jgi:hypothetical protein
MAGRVVSKSLKRGGAVERMEENMRKVGMAALIVLACAFLTSAPGAVTPLPKTLLFRVTSATQGQESKFEGTLAYSTVPPVYRLIGGRTPYELEIPNTNNIGAILKANDENVRLAVEVVERADSPKIKMRWESGHVVIVNIDQQGRSTMVGM